jgi:hypothetical protein
MNAESADQLKSSHDLSRMTAELMQTLSESAFKQFYNRLRKLIADIESGSPTAKQDKAKLVMTFSLPSGFTTSELYSLQENLERMGAGVISKTIQPVEQRTSHYARRAFDNISRVPRPLRAIRPPQIIDPELEKRQEEIRRIREEIRAQEKAERDREAEEFHKEHLEAVKADEIEAIQEKLTEHGPTGVMSNSEYHRAYGKYAEIIGRDKTQNPTRRSRIPKYKTEPEQMRETKAKNPPVENEVNEAGEAGK